MIYTLELVTLNKATDKPWINKIRGDAMQISRLVAPCLDDVRPMGHVVAWIHARLIHLPKGGETHFARTRPEFPGVYIKRTK